jgi:Secretory protein of YscJ/FliF family
MDEHLLTEHDIPDPWWRSPRSRIGLAVAALAVVLGLVQLTSHSTTEMTVLSVPSPLSQDPNEVRRRLQQAGVSSFEYANGQLQVPLAAAESAAAALHSDDSTDRRWADEWEEANAKLGHFSGTRERDAAREIARARQISRMLNQMSGIAHADVVWDDDKAAGWNREAKSRATVYLKPQPGSEITPEIIRSVRAAVAGSKANLSANDVIVMDLDRRITYEATTDEPMRRQQDQQRDERSAIYRRRIEQLLQHVDGIRVGVFIDDVPFQTVVEHPWADPLIEPLASRLPGVAPPMPGDAHFLVPHPPSKPVGSTGEFPATSHGERDAKAASTLLGLNQEMAELVHVHLAVPEEFYHRKLEMRDSAGETTFEVVERDVNSQLQKRVNDALPDSGPSPEVVIDLIPGERIASVPVVVHTSSLDPLRDPSVLYPLCGVGLVFFAIGWAIVAARQGALESTEVASTQPMPPYDSTLHANPLEFLVTSRFSDWLPALMMEPAETLARIVSVLPSQQVGELMARLPMSLQIDVLQLAARQSPPTTQDLEAIAQRLEHEAQVPAFSSQGLFHRATNPVG